MKKIYLIIILIVLFLCIGFASIFFYKKDNDNKYINNNIENKIVDNEVNNKIVIDNGTNNTETSLKDDTEQDLDKNYNMTNNTIVEKTDNNKTNETNTGKENNTTKKDSIILVESISLNKTKIILARGKNQSLVATVSPINATDNKITWISSNTSVATVDANGLITAQGKGSTVITAKSSNGKTATCNIIVNVPLEKINITSTNNTIAYDGTIKSTTYSYELVPTDADITGDVEWNYSNSSCLESNINSNQINLTANGYSSSSNCSNMNPTIYATYDGIKSNELSLYIEPKLTITLGSEDTSRGIDIPIMGGDASYSYKMETNAVFDSNVPVSWNYTYNLVDPIKVVLVNTDTRWSCQFNYYSDRTAMVGLMKVTSKAGQQFSFETRVWKN